MGLAEGPEGLDPLYPVGAVSVPWPCSEGCDCCARSSVWWVSCRCLCGVKVSCASVGQVEFFFSPLNFICQERLD